MVFRNLAEISRQAAVPHVRRRAIAAESSFCRGAAPDVTHSSVTEPIAEALGLGYRIRMPCALVVRAVVRAPDLTRTDRPVGGRTVEET
ncbi:hypothetical protein GCM10009676_24420 [Prauserella halophila]|uniref:Uncharacterized protein n=1 Tax=Prauserella halophila TaxID=185641 RepID=A0ABP4GV29_9PSEU|nr:hypothetical protein [Prauserella halophila]